MERLLSKLFDYQHFERNPDLQIVIDRVDARYAAAELSDEELGMLSAAGDPGLRSQVSAPRRRREDGLGSLKSGRDI